MKKSDTEEVRNKYVSALPKILNGPSLLTWRSAMCRIIFGPFRLLDNAHLFYLLFQWPMGVDMKKFNKYRICWKCSMFEHCRIQMQTSSHPYWKCAVVQNWPMTAGRMSLLCWMNADCGNLRCQLFNRFSQQDTYNGTDVAHYNFDTDQPILIIFDRDVAKTVCLSNGDLLSHLS